MRPTITLAALCAASIACAQNFGLAETFGSGGAATFLPGPGENTLNTHHFLPDGRMLVTGTGYDYNLGNHHVSMARMDTVCGALDPDFGNAGMVQHYHEQSTVCRATALQPDGKIVGCGMIAPSNAGSQQWPGVFRYNADGSVDSTFNGTGYHRTLFDIGAPEGDFNRVFVHADSSITCVGAAFGGKIGAYRFTTDGALDTTFSGDGHAFVNTPSYCYSGAGTGVILADSSIISVAIAFEPQIALAKFTHEGAVDTTFGDSGLAMSGISASVSGQMGIAVQSDGKILISCFQGGNNDTFLMVRFMPDGSVDPSYGTAGASLVVTPNTRGMGMQLLADGSTLQFGYRDGNGAVLKRDANGQVVTTFGNNGFVEAFTAITESQVFAHGELLPDGRLFGHGVSPSGGECLVIKMATDPTAYALPVISVVDADLVTTGTGTMQWFLNGAPISGATGSTYTPAENGDYTVQMTITADCIYTSSVYALLNVGVEELSSGTVQVFNNGNGSIVVVNDASAMPYDLLDLNGKPIASGTLRTGRIEMQFGVAQGVYLLRTIANNIVNTERIIVY